MLGSERYNFTKWGLLSLVTCGLYHLYYEYIMAKDVVQVYGDTQSSEPMLCLILAGFGFPIISDAIIQNRINKYYGGSPV
jgi:hypothetical protein